MELIFAEFLCRSYLDIVAKPILASGEAATGCAAYEETLVTQIRTRKFLFYINNNWIG